jgi:hypothetical protein
MVDIDLLRRLGWSEELIGAVKESTAPIDAPIIDEIGSQLDLVGEAPGSMGLHMADSPPVGSSALPPPPLKSAASR